MSFELWFVLIFAERTVLNQNEKSNKVVSPERKRLFRILYEPDTGNIFLHVWGSDKFNKLLKGNTSELKLDIPFNIGVSSGGNHQSSFNFQGNLIFYRI